MTVGPKADATLAEWQAYVQRKIEERGFADETTQQKFMLLVEEVGELAKAVRQLVGMKFTDTTRQQELREELADVQIVLLGLASMVGEDMFHAVADKEQKNRTREWK